MSLATLLGGAARHAAVAVAGRRASITGRRSRAGARRGPARIAELLESRQYLTAAIADPSFETVGVSTGYQYDPTGSAWTFAGDSGVIGNGSGFTAGNPAAPQGTQVAFLQETGSIMQTVTGWTAGSYQLSFAAAQRGNYNVGGQDFQVLVDGASVGTFKPAGTS